MADAFDLSRFAPPELTRFTLRKHGDQVFAVDGDPEVDDVARMLRIENAFRTVEADDDVADAFLEGKQLLLRMIREQDDTVTELRITSQEIAIVFALILRGPSVAEAVMDAIANSNNPVEPPAGDRESVEGDEASLDGGGGHGDAAPLPSPRSSSGSSSTSDENDGSHLAIGTA